MTLVRLEPVASPSRVKHLGPIDNSGEFHLALIDGLSSMVSLTNPK